MELERINNILLGSGLALVSSGFWKHLRLGQPKLDPGSNNQVCIGLISSTLAGTLIVYRAIRN